MKSKQFKHLNRAELVEIIYQLQLDLQKLQQENGELKEKLEAKEIKIANAGSIAEAAMGISDIFAQAQAVADNYLAEVYRSSGVPADEILAGAQAQADEIIRKAEKTATEKMIAASETIKAILKSNPTLQASWEAHKKNREDRA